MVDDNQPNAKKEYDPKGCSVDKALKIFSVVASIHSSR